MKEETKKLSRRLHHKIHRLWWTNEVENFVDFAQMCYEIEEKCEFKKFSKRMIGSVEEIKSSCSKILSDSVSESESNLDDIVSVDSCYEY